LRLTDGSKPFGFSEWAETRDALLRTYPFVSYEPIGHSVLGKEIGAFRLGNGTQAVHYNGAMHANEWITTPLLLQFLEDCARAVHLGEPMLGRDIERLLEKVTLWVVPLVNPDGVELVVRGLEKDHPFAHRLLQWNGGSASFEGWKANIRGVDLNDQFPAYWETERERRDASGPGPRDYTGVAPLTEPEAKALAAFTEERDFQLVMAFHTQGREIYWNYRDCEPPEAEEAARRLAAASGYEAVKLTGSDAGYKDWFIQRFRRLGFTIEAGYGTNPLPLDEYDGIYKELLPLMLEGLELALDVLDEPGEGPTPEKQE